MDCLIGFRCDDYVMLAADLSKSNSIILMKTNENKIHKLNDKLLMAICGEAGDTTHFSEYIEKNIQLYKMRNGYELSPKAAVSFTRRNLAESLRTTDAYNVNLLIAGYDDHSGPVLYSLDYLAASMSIPFGAFGYGGFFAMSVLDTYHRPNMNVEEGYELIQKCVREVQKRLVINLPNFKVQVINKNGIMDMPIITSNIL